MSKTIKTGGAAFPRPRSEWRNWNGEPCASPPQEGMTTRDYFAAAALAGLLSNPRVIISPGSNVTIAKDCYGIADALLDERERGGG